MSDEPRDHVIRILVRPAEILRVTESLAKRVNSKPFGPFAAGELLVISTKWERSRSSFDDFSLVEVFVRQHWANVTDPDELESQPTTPLSVDFAEFIPRESGMFPLGLEGRVNYSINVLV